MQNELKVPALGAAIGGFELDFFIILGGMFVFWRNGFRRLSGPTTLDDQVKGLIIVLGMPLTIAGFIWLCLWQPWILVAFVLVVILMFTALAYLIERSTREDEFDD